MGANGSDDDGRDDSWSWNDKWLKSIKDEHDQFFAELKDEGQRLEKQLRNDDNTTTSPFAAFKQFVDSNFHALTDGLRNFPNNIAELRAKMQREQERMREEELDISRRWTGSDDTPDHVLMELLRSTENERRDAFDATTSLLVEARRQNVQVSNAKVEALFRDPESTLGYLDRLASPLLALGGAWYYMPETGDRLPTGDSWRWLAPQPRWLSVDWFKRSPYSPIRLEAHPDLGLEGAKWRAAFEDLMDATLDKPMGSIERVGMRALYGKPQSTYYGPGLEWLLSLQCRGILPPLCPRTYNDVESKALLGQASIIDTIQRHKQDLSLTSEKAAWHTPLHTDLTDLMSEVATKATADTEAEPIERSTPYKIQAATEQDLYDSPYTWSSASLSDTEESSTRSEANAKLNELTPAQWRAIDRESEWRQIPQLQIFFEALTNSDIEAAAKVLDDWYEHHGSIDELLMDEWRRNATLDAAFLKSKLPHDDPHKLEAQSRLLEKAGVDEDDLAWSERRLDYIRRFNEATERNAQWVQVSDEELEELVERLEQERENLDRMVGERVVEKSVTQKKPEVLSALTTTETTRLPDGTVTTKVVLKKRFADGREETSESVHTANENLEQQRQEGSEDHPKKKGWFWS